MMDLSRQCFSNSQFQSFPVGWSISHCSVCSGTWNEARSSSCCYRAVVAENLALSLSSTPSANWSSPHLLPLTSGPASLGCHED